ncbi:hypothetical protein PVK06_016816 [Gossypium arboreum]|uniref:Uncharacterized protein n=1 Tax=Gossypium arboreum TaxID=29729 RepID=A0ABR0Q1F0_GOSAR|nr:hypothetical protein PVK06_016816 [Gossypium arboreum]
MKRWDWRDEQRTQRGNQWHQQRLRDQWSDVGEVEYGGYDWPQVKSIGLDSFGRLNQMKKLADGEKKEDRSGCRGSLQTPENSNYGGCSYNVPIPCHHLEIHPEVLATTEDGDEGSDNEGSDKEGFDSEDLSDPDLDDIPKDIDNESPVEGEDID